jgi:hypothetical protein
MSSIILFCPVLLAQLLAGQILGTGFKHRIPTLL